MAEPIAGVPPPAVVYEREMGITHGEFLRTLTNAVEGRRYALVDRRIDIEDGAHRIVIELGVQRERRIASLRLPVTDVRYRFEGHDAASAAAVMARFEMYFHRGGG